MGNTIAIPKIRLLKDTQNISFYNFHLLTNRMPAGCGYFSHGGAQSVKLHEWWSAPRIVKLSLSSFNLASEVSKVSSALGVELDETRIALENAQRARKLAESALEEAQARIADLTHVNTSLCHSKLSLEKELAETIGELNEISRQLRAGDERASKAIADWTSAVEQLLREQDNATQAESQKKAVEQQLQQVQMELRDRESINQSTAEKALIRMRELELTIDDMRRRLAAADEAVRKKDKRIREVQQAVEDEKRNAIIAHEAATRMQEKLNGQKKFFDEYEKQSELNRQRLRRCQSQLSEAEGRAEQAEGQLHLMQVKNRSATIMGNTTTIPKLRLLKDARSTSFYNFT